MKRYIVLVTLLLNHPLFYAANSDEFQKTMQLIDSLNARLSACEAALEQDTRKQRALKHQLDEIRKQNDANNLALKNQRERVKEVKDSVLQHIEKELAKNCDNEELRMIRVKVIYEPHRAIQDEVD